MPAASHKLLQVGKRGDVESGRCTEADLAHCLWRQLQQEQDQGISDGDGLTMKRLVVWTYDPLLRLKTLAALVDACKGGWELGVGTFVWGVSVHIVLLANVGYG